MRRIPYDNLEPITKLEFLQALMENPVFLNNVEEAERQYTLQAIQSPDPVVREQSRQRVLSVQAQMQELQALGEQLRDEVRAGEKPLEP